MIASGLRPFSWAYVRWIFQVARFFLIAFALGVVIFVALLALMAG